VNQLVPDAGHSTPRDCRVSIAHGLGDALRGLANDFQRTHDCECGLFVRREGRLTHPAEEGSRLLASGDDVLEEVSVGPHLVIPGPLLQAPADVRFQRVPEDEVHLHAKQVGEMILRATNRSKPG
jgi:hypothetical protein